MPATGIRIDGDTLETINQRLTYGDSRSQWFQEAAELRLMAEDVLADHGYHGVNENELQGHVRQALVEYVEARE